MKTEIQFLKLAALAGATMLVRDEPDDQPVDRPDDQPASHQRDRNRAGPRRHRPATLLPLERAVN